MPLSEAQLKVLMKNAEGTSLEEAREIVHPTPEYLKRDSKYGDTNRPNRSKTNKKNNIFSKASKDRTL